MSRGCWWYCFCGAWSKLGCETPAAVASAEESAVVAIGLVKEGEAKRKMKMKRGKNVAKKSQVDREDNKQRTRNLVPGGCSLNISV